jgi:2-methylcitrate dehydratase PrpD
MSSMRIEETYAQYCRDLTYEDIPADVVDYAKRLLLDIVGISVGAATRVRSSESVISGVRRLDGDGSGATVLATGESMRPANAALLNGALGHSLDYDDTHRSASLHPGVVTVPAALAAGDTADASGRDLLTGIVAGYEVVCRLGKAVTPSSHYDLGFHGTKTCGVFGATAAAGTVLDVEAGQLEAAFGVNGSQASGSLQFLENGSWNKRIHPGLAAHEALTALSFASEGFFAASDPIEGKYGFLHGYTRDPQPALATEGLGDEFELHKTGLKPYPCCRYMHTALDLLVEIAETESIAPENVMSVTVEMPSTGATIVDSATGDYPDTFVDAQFSMPFGAALVLTQGDPGVDSFLDVLEAPYTETFERLFDATTVTSSREVDAEYPEKWPARVVVETGTGTYERYAEYAKGEPENPMGWDEVTEKFEDLAASLPAPTRQTVIDRVENVETVTVAELLEPFADQTPLAERS